MILSKAFYNVVDQVLKLNFSVNKKRQYFSDDVTVGKVTVDNAGQHKFLCSSLLSMLSFKVDHEELRGLIMILSNIYDGAFLKI